MRTVQHQRYELENARRRRSRKPDHARRLQLNVQKEAGYSKIDNELIPGYMAYCIFALRQKSEFLLQKTLKKQKHSLGLY